MYLGTCGSFKFANHIKDWTANRKYAKCRKSSNQTNYISPQTCGFAICGTYLRTAHAFGNNKYYPVGTMYTLQKHFSNYSYMVYIQNSLVAS